MSNSIVKNKLSKPVNSLTTNKEDLKKFFRILQERADSACELECNHIESILELEDIEKSKEELRSCSELKLTVKGIDGEELFGNIDEVFNSLSFPDKIKNIYLNSGIQYQSKFNYYPRNQFEVLLDFNRPKVFDFSFMPGDETPNNSNFVVEGFDSTWVNGLFGEIDIFFKKNSAQFSTIHKSNIYDLFVWLIGIPTGFWLCFKVSEYLKSTFENEFLRAGVFVYVFIATLFSFRILFQYSRWLYPKIHYSTKGDTSLIHKSFFFTLITSIIAAFLLEILL